MNQDATLADRISAALTAGAADDDQLAAQPGVARQVVNQTARRMQAADKLVRSVGTAGKIVNALAGEPSPTQLATPIRVAPTARTAGPVSGPLSEDEVKGAVRAHLEERGWAVTVAWGRQRGIDIDAVRGDERLVLEAKGEVRLQPQQVNYFLGALGELVQRMDDADASYGLALPDNRQYRGLVGRLPRLARHRLGLTVFFVRRHGDRYEIDESS